MNPLLSICIPSYNKSEWLAFTANDILEQIKAFGEEVELVISDNASEDDTQERLRPLKGNAQLSVHRNAENVGANKNFFKCAELARGAFVWMIGNDDLIREGAIKRILTELHHSPDLEYLFVNYTKYSPPQSPQDLSQDLPFHPTGSDDLSEYRIERIADLAGLDYNCFTPIYCSVMKREHMLKATEKGINRAFFDTLETTVPHALYIIENLLEKPGYYIGYPYIMASHSTTWEEHAPFYVLEYLPQLYKKLEEKGVPRKITDALRATLIKASQQSLYFMLTHPQSPNRERFSFKNYCKRNAHLWAFWKTLLELSPKFIKYYTSKHFWLPKIRPTTFPQTRDEL